MTLTLFDNTYIILTDANAYFDGRLYSDAWTNADNTDREKALIMASKRVDKLCYIGYQKLVTQKMQFPRLFDPRNFGIYFTSPLLPELPQDIADAVCEEALALLDYGNSAHLKNQKLNISSVNIGIGSTSYNTPAQNALISKEAFKLVSKWTQKGFSVK